MVFLCLNYFLEMGRCCKYVSIIFLPSAFSSHGICLLRSEWGKWRIWSKENLKPDSLRSLLIYREIQSFFPNYFKLLCTKRIFSYCFRLPQSREILYHQWYYSLKNHTQFRFALVGLCNVLLMGTGVTFCQEAI